MQIDLIGAFDRANHQGILYMLYSVVLGVLCCLSEHSFYLIDHRCYGRRALGSPIYSAKFVKASEHRYSSGAGVTSAKLVKARNITIQFGSLPQKKIFYCCC